MTPPKIPADLGTTSTEDLLARRRALAEAIGDPQWVLAGSLVEQHRRCGKPGCSCAGGDGHGPYAYFSPRQVERGRLRYVPARLVGLVRRYLDRCVEVEAALAEISAINVELLARRELT
ncbi:DUF6788 family protein [Frankia sp. KB5]|uniref:DUF6788 family protein n=1 Tax=Frankia sp. KB5 TaxID=683318 RepID=UPI000A103045|nr:hypothetical protein KBI5_24105 [Frankia sp. KB5]